MDTAGFPNSQLANIECINDLMSLPHFHKPGNFWEKIMAK